jgi:murein L,D-transpeptidase YafK
LSKLLKGNAEVRLRLYKSTYRLEVLQRGRVVKTYPVVLGGNPKDDKLREGDQCTPEGDFLVRGKYPHRDWDRFLWLNYPTAKSWEKHREAKDARRIPQGAGIGSGIGIHGVPVGRDEWIDRRENWTLGCISLKRAHIEELYSVLKVGTKVSILP